MKANCWVTHLIRCSWPSWYVMWLQDHSKWPFLFCVVTRNHPTTKKELPIPSRISCCQWEVYGWYRDGIHGIKTSKSQWIMGKVTFIWMRMMELCSSIIASWHGYTGQQRVVPFLSWGGGLWYIGGVGGKNSKHILGHNPGPWARTEVKIGPSETRNHLQAQGKH